MAVTLVLIDTNVIVAALAEAHEHHAASLALFAQKPTLSIAVAAHSYAEAFSTLTRLGTASPFRWPPDEAWAALESLAAASRLVGLTPAQSIDAVRDFAAAGHIGARVYNHLIIRAAQAAGVRLLVTWNVGHFRSLAKSLEIRTPSELAAS